MITGGARRIGAEIARHFAGRGWCVTVHYRSSDDDARDLRDALERGPGQCALVQGDLGQPDDCDAVFDAALDAFGPVDLLVNNASRFENDDVFGLSDTSFDLHLAVNLKAPVYLSERMARQDGGADRLVVNMLDNKLFALNPDFFSYTISKAALMTATEMLALRFDGAPRICGIAPSVTLISGNQTPVSFEKSARINPLQRRVFPADIARTIAYFWEEPQANGQTIALDGGQNLWSLPRDVAFLSAKGRFDA